MKPVQTRNAVVFGEVVSGEPSDMVGQWLQTDGTSRHVLLGVVVSQENQETGGGWQAKYTVEQPVDPLGWARW